MRVAVVGAGVIGLLTAVECVAAGHQVTVVDRGEIPNGRGASFDRHRILRALHPGDAATTEAAARAHHGWARLQRLLGARFYRRVGALTVLPGEPAGAAAAAGLVRSAGLRARALGAAELARDYPHLRFPPSAPAVLEAGTGVLLADRVLAACAGWLRRQRAAELLPLRTVDAVDGAAGGSGGSGGTVVRLAGGQQLRADAVVVAAGPWSRRLLPGGPDGPTAGDFVLYRQSMVYCRVPAGARPAWSATPAIPSLGRPDGAWLVPPAAGTPLKITAATACREVGDVDEDTGTATADRWREHLVAMFAGIIPGFGPGWVTGARDCHYLSHRATAGPVPVGLGERAVALAACGGVSFKFAPLIARSLLDRVAWPDRPPAGTDLLGRPQLSTAHTTTGSEEP